MIGKSVGRVWVNVGLECLLDSIHDELRAVSRLDAVGEDTSHITACHRWWGLGIPATLRGPIPANRRLQGGHGAMGSRGHGVMPASCRLRDGQADALLAEHDLLAHLRQQQHHASHHRISTHRQHHDTSIASICGVTTVL